MSNWLRIDNSYINLDNIIQITTDEKRPNYTKPWTPDDGNFSGYPIEPCVIFYGPAAENVDNRVVMSEIMVFGQERERVIKWLNERTDILELPIV